LEFLLEICEKEERKKQRIGLKRIRMIIVSFPYKIIEIVACYNEDVNDDSLGLTHILTKGETWMEIEKVNTRCVGGTV
jgi:hypothetical protein